MEFVEKSFHEVKEFIKRFLEEVIEIDNIKARILIDNKNNQKLRRLLNYEVPLNWMS